MYEQCSRTKFSVSIMFSSSSKERKHIVKYWRKNFISKATRTIMLTIVRKWPENTEKCSTLGLTLAAQQQGGMRGNW